jgi:uncharacterized membrane protein
MDSLFYTISGLPIHALVVHFAVVLLPLASAAFIASIYYSKFKSNYALVSIVGIFLGTGAAFVAKQSGEALATHIGNPQEHSKLGNVLPLYHLVYLFFLCFGTNQARVVVLKK